LFIAALLVIAGLGLAIYAFATADEAVDDTAATWTRGAGVFFLLFFLLFAWVLYRKVFPPKARGLKVTVAATEVRRGGTIDARLEIAHAGRSDDEIEFGLVCTEYYDIEKTSYSSNGGTTRYRDTADAIAYEDWRPVSPSQGMHNVRFEVPAEGPFSFRGSCLSFEWRVSARQPKKLRFDRSTNVDVQVLA
jgi:hypothetical protein